MAIRYLTLSWLVLNVLLSCSTVHKAMVIPSSCTQMVVVVSDSLKATQGKLYCYEKNGSDWKLVKQPVPVCLGKHGMAWGVGLHAEDAMEGVPAKKEGDGCSPAGVYSFSVVFGQKPSDQVGLLHMPYIPIQEMTECVDDVNSVYYNQIVSKDEIEKSGKVDWKSSEKMKSIGALYELGVVVNHNTRQIKRGGGSCIFFHVWSGPNSYTGGCTSMELQNMQAFAQWLDQSKNPTLVQLTRPLYTSLMQKWELPALP